MSELDRILDTMKAQVEMKQNENDTKFSNAQICYLLGHVVGELLHDAVAKEVNNEE